MAYDLNDILWINELSIRGTTLHTKLYLITDTCIFANVFYVSFTNLIFQKLHFLFSIFLNAN